jgi:arylsulfatase A-like enzyme
VLRCKATDKDDTTEQPHWGRVGKQTIEDTGPLDRKRMETIDDETTSAAIDYMGRQVQANKPFFVWMNTTRMHVFTHVRESMRGQSGIPGNEYADGMIEHDNDVGKLLKALDDLGITNNTIVIYTTDNGPVSSLGRTLPQRRSAAKRTRTGKVHSACRAWFAGRVISSRVPSRPTCFPA